MTSSREERQEEDTPPHVAPTSRKFECLKLGCETCLQDLNRLREELQQCNEEIQQRKHNDYQKLESLKKEMRKFMDVSDWSTGLFNCISCGEHRGVDLKICLLGTFAPCILCEINCVGSGECLENHDQLCLLCSATFCLAMYGFAWTSSILYSSYCSFMPLAWVASSIMIYPRTAIRQRYNIQVDTRAFYGKVYYCCSKERRERILNDDDKMESLQTSFDHSLHSCCSFCAQCQDAREMQRRGQRLMFLHSSSSSSTYAQSHPDSLVPPAMQAMDRM